jgi:calreticulin
MRASTIAVALLGLLACASATTYFNEGFDAGWESRWVKSKNKESEGTQGKWGWTAGKYYGDAEADKGLQTSEDARFYQISAEFPEFSNKGKDLVVQFNIKHEQNLDCGGGYIKILPAGVNQENFNGDDKYNIMFGPDICGTSTRKTHLIFQNKGNNYLIKKEIPVETDTYTHVYTLVLHPDNTFEVYTDGREVTKGNLKDDFDILPPRQIKDPQASKPADWVDERMIPDPEDKKPEGWDDTPREIRDPDAKKPDDWDDDLDGEWEAPMIPNPEFRGEWRPKMIENPAYKGEWVHPLVDNPDFKDDDTLYQYDSNKYVGIEIWQVKAGTIFDNIIVTDNKAEADVYVERANKTRDAEKKAEEEERKKNEAASAGSDDGHGHTHDEL